MKNSSRFEEKIEQNFTRSSRGVFASAASSRRRALKSSQESSRLSTRAEPVAFGGLFARVTGPRRQSSNVAACVAILQEVTVTRWGTSREPFSTEQRQRWHRAMLRSVPSSTRERAPHDEGSRLRHDAGGPGPHSLGQPPDESRPRASNR